MFNIYVVNDVDTLLKFFEIFWATVDLSTCKGKPVSVERLHVNEVGKNRKGKLLESPSLGENDSDSYDTPREPSS